MAKHKPREDQQSISGIGDEKNPRIHNAAKIYAKRRDERIAASALEKEQKTKLMEVMKEEAVDTYSYGDVDVSINHKDDVSVVIGDKKKKAAEEEKDEEAE